MRDFKGLFLLSVLLLSILFIILPKAALSHETSIEDALAWLREHQDQDNGTWGDDCIRETATVIRALTILNETGSTYSAGLQFLEAASPENTDYLSRKITALAGADITSDEEISYLISLQNSDGGFGFSKGYPSSVVDSLLAAEALHAAGIQDKEVVGKLLYYLTQRQKENGGFSFTDDADENLYLTAYAIPVLNSYQPQYNLSSYISKSSGFVMCFRHMDGGFGEGDSNITETALCIKALSITGGNSTEIFRARQFLLAGQQPDGCWDSDPNATAIVLSALGITETVERPNLVIENSSITINPAVPANGQQIFVSCIVKNTGVIDAQNVKVAFYLDNPLNGAAENAYTVIENIKASESITVETSWMLTNATGATTVYVFADSNNDIPEITDSDNIASKAFTSGSAPELVINTENVTFSNNAPYAGERFTVATLVYNTGEADADLVRVSVFNGHPEQGGTAIISLTFSSITGGSSARAEFELALNAGLYDLYVFVDSGRQVIESNEDNNIAGKHIVISPSEAQGVDLLITADKISFSNKYPKAGDSITISAEARNIGNQQADNVTIKLYDGDPLWGGIMLAQNTFDCLPAGQSAIFHFTTTGLPAGLHVLYAVAEIPDEGLETNASNNSAYQTLTVLPGQQTILDVAVHHEDITYEPLELTEGQTVCFQCCVRNTGTVAIKNLKVRIYDETPDKNGILLVPEVTVPQLAEHKSSCVNFCKSTMKWGGSHDLFVVVDPDNETIEDNETNNRACRTIFVKSTEQFDLYADQIQIIPGSNPGYEDNMTFIATFKNGSADSHTDVDVIFYDGRPEEGGKILGNFNFPILYGGDSVQAILKIPAFMLPGQHTLCVAVDPLNKINEINEYNNRFERLLSIPAPDLTIDQQSIQVSAAEPMQGEIFNLNALIKNTGTWGSVQNVWIEVHDGYPDNESTKIAETVLLPVPQGTSVPVSFNIALSEVGHHMLYIIADPQYSVDGFTYNLIYELDEENNTASRSLFVEQATVPECENGESRTCTNECGAGRQHCANNFWQPCITIDPPVEICDGVDNDCDGEIDEDLLKTFYRDADNDSFGDESQSVQGCAPPEGFVPIYECPLAGLNESLAAHYPFNGNANDESGNGHHGNIFGGAAPAVDRYGSENSAYYFDGIDDYISIADDPFLDLPNIGTVCVWFNMYEKNDDPNNNIINKYRDDTAGEGGYLIAADQLNGYNDARMLVKSTGNQISVAPHYSFTGFGDWKFACLVFTDNATEGFINGHSLGKGNYIKPSTGNPRPVLIGAGHRYDSVIYNFFHGMIDDIRIYNRALSGKEIQSLYCSAVGIDSNGNGVSDSCEICPENLFDCNDSDNAVNPVAVEIPDNGKDDDCNPDTNNDNGMYQPDFEISAEDISFSTEVFYEGEPVTITATIENIGEKNCSNVKVSCYDGNPEQGGPIIGTKIISFLDKDESADAKFIWWVQGSIHEIHVLVDPDNETVEENEENNHAYRKTLASQPDLAVTTDDIVTDPVNPLPGQSVSISATIHNFGQETRDIIVRFVEGSTPVCPDQTIDVLPAGDFYTIAPVLYNIFDMQDRHYIHVIADPQNVITEANEYNNEAITAIDVVTPSLPDLFVTDPDITLITSSVTEGDLVTISATIGNWGTEIAGARVVFYDNSTTGVSIINDMVIYENMQFGQTKHISFPWLTAGRAGEHKINVVVDPVTETYPDGFIIESDESNNRASKNIIVNSCELFVEVLTSKIQYRVNEADSATVIISNTGDVGRTVTMSLVITDICGNILSELMKPELGISIEGNDSKVISKSFAIGPLPAGIYSIRALVFENYLPRTQAESPFFVLSDNNTETLSASITPSRTLYYAHEQVILTSAIRSFSANHVFNGLHGSIMLKDAAGTEFFSAERALDNILPMQSIQWESTWNTGTSASGAYKVVFIVKENDTIVAEDNATFSILASFEGKRGFVGQLTVEPQHVHAGQSIAFNYQVKNIGNVNIANLHLTIEALNVETQALIGQLVDNCSVQINSTCNSTLIMSTEDMPLGNAIAILTGDADDKDQSIAFASFTVVNQCPVAGAGADRIVQVGQTVELNASESFDPDNDDLICQWVLVSKPAASTSVINDAQSPLCSITPDRRGEYILELTVYDGVCRSEADRVIVSTENRPPIAEAGPDQEITVGNTVQLSGLGSIDPDGDIITNYRWLMVSKPNGSLTQLSDNSSAEPTFLADMPGSYHIQLIVSDGDAESMPDMIMITAVDAIPAGCSDMPFPDAPCSKKTDYPNEHCSSSVITISSYSDYFNYVSSNYGYDNKGYKNIKIIKDIDRGSGDLILHSPCMIEMKKKIRLRAQKGIVCLDGKKGVKGGNGCRIDARSVALMSERGDVGITQGARINADEIYLEGYGSVIIESGSHITADGSVTLVTEGKTQTGITSIKNGIYLSCGSLFIKSTKNILIYNLSAIDILGPLRMISQSDVAEDGVQIKYTAIMAESLCMEGQGEVSISGISALAVNGNVSLMSRGAIEKSIAWIKSGTAITAGSLNLEGYRAIFDPYTFLYIDGDFHMEASDESRCVMRGLYRAESVSGNCFE